MFRAKQQILRAYGFQSHCWWYDTEIKLKTMWAPLMYSPICLCFVRDIFGDFAAWEFAFRNRNGVISYLVDVFTDTINHLHFTVCIVRSVHFVISVTHFDFTCDIHTNPFARVDGTKQRLQMINWFWTPFVHSFDGIFRTIGANAASNLISLLFFQMKMWKTKIATHFNHM